MLAKSVMRNATGLRSRISEQVVIYNEWKKLAEEFNDEEVQGILTDARWKLIESIRMKRNIEQIIMANPNADELIHVRNAVDDVVKHRKRFGFLLTHELNGKVHATR